MIKDKVIVIDYKYHVTRDKNESIYRADSIVFSDIEYIVAAHWKDMFGLGAIIRSGNKFKGRNISSLLIDNSCNREKIDFYNAGSIGNEILKDMDFYSFEDPGDIVECKICNKDSKNIYTLNGDSWFCSSCASFIRDHVWH